MKKNREPVRVTLRIPADIHDLLSVAVDTTGNSLNAEIVCRLRDSLSTDHPQELTTTEKVFRQIIREELDKQTN